MMFEFGSAILEAAGGYLVREFGPKLPDLARHISKSGISLKGKWEINQAKKTARGGVLRADWKTLITIDQLGQQIKGKALSTCLNNNTPDVEYVIYGKFENGYLYVYFRDKDKNEINFSSFLLKSVNGGSKLVGHRLFVGRNSDDARSIECSWLKQGNRSHEFICSTG